jgi:hypothetical protein
MIATNKSSAADNAHTVLLSPWEWLEAITKTGTAAYVAKLRRRRDQPLITRAVFSEETE